MGKFLAFLSFMRKPENSKKEENFESESFGASWIMKVVDSKLHEKVGKFEER